MSRERGPRTGPERAPAALLVLVLTALTSSALPAAARETWDLAVTLEPRAVTVGDRVHVTLSVTAPEPPRDRSGASEPRFPTWGDTWGEAEILEAEPAERAPDAPRWRQRLVLAAFRTGVLDLPPQRIRLPWGTGPAGGRTLSTPDTLSLTVRSVLPADADPGTVEPAAPSPVRALPAGERFWWTLGIAASLALASLLAAAARGRRREVAAAPRVPAYRQLLARLEELAVPASLTPSAEAAVVARRHVELSRALRRYLGRSLDFPARESTTPEIRQCLRRLAIPDALVSRSEELLRSCDLVKFAAEPAGSACLRRRVDGVRELARALEEHLRLAVEHGDETPEEA